MRGNHLLNLRGLLNPSVVSVTLYCRLSSRRIGAFFKGCIILVFLDKSIIGKYNGQYINQYRLFSVILLPIMSKKTFTLLPLLQRVLAELGENIRLARLRRNFSTTIVAERAGITRNTLRAIERGESSVAFGAYASVLFCLGLEKDLHLIARDDELGRKLQDVGLPIKARSSRLKRAANLRKE